jgi:hypothetical protein
MTLVVGFNMRHYALIGADTRVCYYPDGHLQYRDDEEKIRHTSMGLISGAGLCNLLDPVKQRLEENEITNTDQIREAIRAERRFVEQWFPNPDARLREAIAHTAWMLTYFHAEKPQSYADITLRLAITIPQDDYKLGLFPADSGGMIPPSGLTPTEERELRDMCHDGIKPWNDEQEPVVENIAHHAGLIGRVIRRASELSEMVSASFQLGVQTIHDTGISSIVGEDGAVEWTWHRVRDDGAA